MLTFTTTPISRRTALRSLAALVAAAAVTGCNRHTEVPPEPTLPERNWSPVRAQIDTKMKELGHALSVLLLQNYPKHAALIEKMNLTEIPFGNYASAMYDLAINSSKTLDDGRSLTTELQSGPQLLFTSSPRSRESLGQVMSILADPELPELFTHMILSGTIYQRNNSTSLNEFDTAAIDYLALRCALKAINQVENSPQTVRVIPRKLEFYNRPASLVAEAKYDYIDLASGNNLEDYLPYLLVYGTQRRLRLFDISPYVARSWSTLASTLELPNVGVELFDIRNMSSKTLPEKIGTLRLQNVGAWVTDLTPEWAKNVMDVIGLDGQIIIAQPSSYLFNQSTGKPREVDVQTFMDELAPDADNRTLIRLLAREAKGRSDAWSLRFGYIDRSGTFQEGKSGYVQRADDGRVEIFENVLVFRKEK